MIDLVRLQRIEIAFHAKHAYILKYMPRIILVAECQSSTFEQGYLVVNG